MKQFVKITLLACLLAMAGTAKAQEFKTTPVEFAPVGAEWYYERSYHEGFSLTGITYDRFRSTRTLDINGWPCKEIELFRNLDCDGLVNPSTSYRYVTQDGDQVFEVENGERLLLYDFSKEAGEFWYAPKYQDTIYVEDVDWLQLEDGSYRKVLMTRPGSNEDLYFYHVIEGVGLRYSVFPFMILWGPPPCREGPLRCYSENGVPLITSSVECDYEVLSTDDYAEPHEPTVAIAPNPASSWAHVDYTLPEGCRHATLHIVNALGAEVFTTVLEGDKGTKALPLNDLPNGVYGYTARCGGTAIEGKLVIVR